MVVGLKKTRLNLRARWMGFGFGELAAAGLGCLMALMACQSLLPASSPPQDKTALSAYRDSVLDLDMRYPTGWIPDSKRTFGYTGSTWNVYFQPPTSLATRRFTIKIIRPDQPDLGRTLGQFKAEMLARLAAAGSDVRIIDTNDVVLGGTPAYQAEYLTYLDGKPYVHMLEIICLRHGDDFSLSFESAEATADDDMLLFSRVVDGFGFYSP